MTATGHRSRVTPRFGIVSLAPLLGAIGLFGVLYWGLMYKTDELPSALIGKEVPAFSLPPVRGRALGFSSADLVGEVSIVNVFASWCVPCRDEHPLLTDLARRDVVPIHGINYKDLPEQAEAWLDELGDPYTRTGADIDGRVAYRHVGPISPTVLEQTLLPLVARLQDDVPGRTGE